MKKKLIVVLVLALTCITLLTGCSGNKPKTLTATAYNSGRATEIKIETKLAFHYKGNPEHKLVFAEVN